MQTREKFGTQVKRLFKSIYDHRKEILTLQRMLQLGKDSVMPDIRKLIDAIFILEGLGLITRISKKNFIFSGFKGVTNRIVEGLLNKVKKGGLFFRENWLFSEEVTFEKKVYNIRQSVYIGHFYQDILSSIFTLQTKTMSREAIEKLLELVSSNLLKDSNQLVILNEMISVMTTFNVLEKRNPMDNKTELFEVYQWNGPDIFNNKNLQVEALTYTLKLKEQLYSRVNLNHEKEKLYYQFIFRDWGPDALGENKVKVVQKRGDIDVSNVPREHITHFPKLSFAMLKGKNWSFLVQKLVTIIGRANPIAFGRKKKYKWEVDVELDTTNRTSKQHAVIIFNVNDNCFEIRCLSSKKAIVVDSNTLTHLDKPFPLENKSHIQIVKEQFMFFLPKQISEGQFNYEQEQIQIEILSEIQKMECE